MLTSAIDLFQMFPYAPSTYSINWAEVGRVLSALLTPIIAVIALYIAWQQFTINRRQHRLALFDKRLAVFNSTMKMIASVIQDANATLTDCFGLIRDTREHEFLFGPEIGAFINDLYRKGVELHAQSAVGATGAARQTEILQWFVGRSEEAKKIFRKYMDFTKP